MTQRTAPTWLDSVGFAIAYLFSAFIGRAIVVDEGSTLALFWPAAGVAALWFLVLGGCAPWTWCSSG